MWDLITIGPTVRLTCDISPYKGARVVVMASPHHFDPRYPLTMVTTLIIMGICEPAGSSSVTLSQNAATALRPLWLYTTAMYNADDASGDDYHPPPLCRAPSAQTTRQEVASAANDHSAIIEHGQRTKALGVT